MKTFENLTTNEQELMELLGKQSTPEGQAMQDIETILRAKLPQAGGPISRGDIQFLACYAYHLGRIHGIREERAKRQSKGQGKGGAEK